MVHRSAEGTKSVVATLTTTRRRTSCRCGAGRSIATARPIAGSAIVRVPVNAVGVVNSRACPPVEKTGSVGDHRKTTEQEALRTGSSVLPGYCPERRPTGEWSVEKAGDRPRRLGLVAVVIQVEVVGPDADSNVVDDVVLVSDLDPRLERKTHRPRQHGEGLSVVEGRGLTGRKRFSHGPSVPASLPELRRSRSSLMSEASIEVDLRTQPVGQRCAGTGDGCGELFEGRKQVLAQWLWVPLPRGFVSGGAESRPRRADLAATCQDELCVHEVRPRCSLWHPGLRPVREVSTYTVAAPRLASRCLATLLPAVVG